MSIQAIIQKYISNVGRVRNAYADFQNHNYDNGRAIASIDVAIIRLKYSHVGGECCT